MLMRRLLVLLVATFVAVGLIPAAASAASHDDIVASVLKAPITPDGDVAGAFTDFVITLDGSLDPTVPGRTLLAGKTIKVTLPDDFVNLGLPVGLPGVCTPSSFSCSTGVLLQGWPQNPIPPAPANYTLTLEGTHTIVYTATRDLEPFGAGINGPGIKQMHLILNGFVNPQPGRYDIKVEAETGPGGTLETGVGVARIRAKAKPSINVTSVFAGANTIFQETTVGSEVPFDWDFLVWGKRGTPAVGVEVRQVSAWRAKLVQGNQVIGNIMIRGPKGASGQSISSQGPSTLINGPVLLLPTGRLTLDFVAGNVPGTYVTTLRMNSGNTIEMYVEATPTP